MKIVDRVTLLSSVLAIGACLAAQGGADSRLGDPTKRAVVVLELLDQSGIWKGSATGFVVSPTLIVTCCHCVESVSDVVVNLGSNGLVHVGTVAAEDVAQDVVVLRAAAELPGVAPLELSDALPEDDGEVRVITRTEVGMAVAAYGKWGMVGFGPTGDGLVVVTTARASHGHSGAPIISDMGSGDVVVGMLAAISRTDDKDADGDGVAIPSNVIRSVIQAAHTRADGESLGERLVRRGAISAEAEQLLGEAAAQSRQDASAARKLYQKALGLEPKYFDALRAMATMLASQGKWADVTAEFEHYKESNPNDARASLLEGHIEAGRDNHEAARQCYERAAGINGGSAAAMYWISTAQSKLGDWAAEAESLEKCLRMEPRCAQAYWKLYISYLKVNDMKNAIRTLGRWADAYPKNATPLYAMCQEAKRHGTPEEFEEYLERLSHLSPYVANRMRVREKGEKK